MGTKSQTIKDAAGRLIPQREPDEYGALGNVWQLAMGIPILWSLMETATFVMARWTLLSGVIRKQDFFLQQARVNLLVNLFRGASFFGGIEKPDAAFFEN